MAWGLGTPVVTPLADNELGLTYHNSVTHPSLEASPGKVGKIKRHLVTAPGPISSSFKTEILLAKMKGEWLLESNRVCTDLQDEKTSLSSGPYPFLNQTSPSIKKCLFVCFLTWINFELQFRQLFPAHLFISSGLLEKPGCYLESLHFQSVGLQVPNGFRTFWH